MAAPSSADPNTATEHVEKVPLIEVAFNNGMWWAPPLELSQAVGRSSLGSVFDQFTTQPSVLMHSFGNFTKRTINFA